MRAIFVQIKCEMGHAYKVAREARDSIDELSELYSTSGQYDLLGNAMYTEGDVLIDSVHRFKGRAAPCVILPCTYSQQELQQCTRHSAEVTERS